MVKWWVWVFGGLDCLGSREMKGIGILRGIPNSNPKPPMFHYLKFHHVPKKQGTQGCVFLLPIRIVHNISYVYTVYIYNSNFGEAVS